MTHAPEERGRTWWPWIALLGATTVGASCLFGMRSPYLACEPDGGCPGDDRCAQRLCLPHWLACGNCVDAGKNCGDLDDGCGGTLQCGSCAAPDTCGGGGDANVCGCTGLTDQQLCMGLSTPCGALSIVDGCGVPRSPDCGLCGDGGTCGVAQPNVCCYAETAAQIIARTGAECGAFDAGDLCGNGKLLDAGRCTDGGVCNPTSRQCNCHDLHSACAVDAGCCGVLACDSNLCCKPLGTSCGDAAECCGTLDCAAASAGGSVCCRSPDSGCSIPAECCSGVCTLDGVNGSGHCN